MGLHVDTTADCPSCRCVGVSLCWQAVVLDECRSLPARREFAAGRHVSPLARVRQTAQSVVAGRRLAVAPRVLGRRAHTPPRVGRLRRLIAAGGRRAPAAGARGRGRARRTRLLGRRRRADGRARRQADGRRARRRPVEADRAHRYHRGRAGGRRPVRGGRRVRSTALLARVCRRRGGGALRMSAGTVYRRRLADVRAAGGRLVPRRAGALRPGGGSAVRAALRRRGRLPGRRGRGRLLRVMSAGRVPVPRRASLRAGGGALRRTHRLRRRERRGAVRALRAVGSRCAGAAAVPRRPPVRGTRGGLRRASGLLGRRGRAPLPAAAGRATSRRRGRGRQRVRAAGGRAGGAGRCGLATASTSRPQVARLSRAVVEARGRDRRRGVVVSRRLVRPRAARRVMDVVVVGRGYERVVRAAAPLLPARRRDAAQPAAEPAHDHQRLLVVPRRRLLVLGGLRPRDDAVQHGRLRRPGQRGGAHRAAVPAAAAATHAEQQVRGRRRAGVDARLVRDQHVYGVVLRRL